MLHTKTKCHMMAHIKNHDLSAFHFSLTSIHVQLVVQPPFPQQPHPLVRDVIVDVCKAISIAVFSGHLPQQRDRSTA